MRFIKLYRQLHYCLLNNYSKSTKIVEEIIRSNSDGAEIANNKMSNINNWEADKQKYLNMSLDDRRSLYKKDVTIYTDIPTWLETWKKKSSKTSATTAGIKNVDKISTWSGNITLLEIDAIVNAANRSLLGGGGVDGAIHSAAGPRLKEESRSLAPCEVGGVKITGGYALPARYVIHTVGPKGKKPDKLIECYENSLAIAKEYGLRSIAFPCISTGVYGYPQRDAAEVALGTVKKYLEDNGDCIDRVVFCLFLESDQQIYEELLQKFFPLD